MFKELWLSLKRWIYVRHRLRYVGLYRPNNLAYNPTTFIILTDDLVLIQDYWSTNNQSYLAMCPSYENFILSPKERRGILV